MVTNSTKTEASSVDSKLCFNGAFTRLLEAFARKLPKDPDRGTSLWGVISYLCGLGSTSTCEMLVYLGLDPSILVIAPDWPDPSDEVVMKLCELHGEYYGREERCCECSAERRS